MSESGTLVPSSCVGKLELRNVTFSYSNREFARILDNFSLTIQAGEVVALVGPSGSGKSSIINLFERFYDPISGGVYIDGVSVKDLSPRYLHSKMAIVSQEPTLFARSIKDNIVYGLDEGSYTMEHIIEAGNNGCTSCFLS